MVFSNFIEWTRIQNARRHHGYASARPTQLKKKKGRKRERTKANPTNYNWLNACSEFTLQHILLRIIIPFTPKNARRKLLMINTRNVAIAL